MWLGVWHWRETIHRSLLLIVDSNIKSKHEETNTTSYTLVSCLLIFAWDKVWVRTVIQGEVWSGCLGMKAKEKVSQGYAKLGNGHNEQVRLKIYA